MASSAGWATGIQRRLGNEFSLDVDYQGSTGHKLGLFVDQNQPVVIVADPTVRGSLAPNEQIFPYPTFAAVSTGKDIGNSNYNGVVFVGRYQSRRGVYLQTSYTFSKSIDESSAFFGSTGERAGLADGHNLRLDRGPSSFDVRHRFVTVYVMDLPIGRGHRLFGSNNVVSRELLGGWQISGITTPPKRYPLYRVQQFGGLQRLQPIQ